MNVESGGSFSSCCRQGDGQQPLEKSRDIFVNVRDEIEPLIVYHCYSNLFDYKSDQILGTQNLTLTVIIIFEIIHNSLHLLNSAVMHGLTDVHPQNKPISDTK